MKTKRKSVEEWELREDLDCIPGRVYPAGTKFKTSDDGYIHLSVDGKEELLNPLAMDPSYWVGLPGPNDSSSTYKRFKKKILPLRPRPIIEYLIAGPINRTGRGWLIRNWQRIALLVGYYKNSKSRPNAPVFEGPFTGSGTPITPEFRERFDPKYRREQLTEAEMTKRIAEIRTRRDEDDRKRAG